MVITMVTDGCISGLGKNRKESQILRQFKSKKGSEAKEQNKRWVQYVGELKDVLARKTV